MDQFSDLAPSLASGLTSLNSVLDTYKELDIDPAEFACLKAIILFKPGGDKLDFIELNKISVQK